MWFNCSGEITFNKPLTAEAREVVRKYADEYMTDVWFEESAFKIDDTSWRFDDEAEEMFAELWELDGYVANGIVSYWGDYQGRVYVEDNKVTEIDEREIGLYEASDETLIQMLEKRGYKVYRRNLLR